MTKFTTIDFIIRTAVTAGSVHLANAYLAATQVGQLLGRTITEMPIRGAYVPFASTAAISVISDGIEHFVLNKFFDRTGPTDQKSIVTYNRPKLKALSELVIRVLVGAGLFAAGVAVTGGSILPALATGAAVGTLVYVANKIIDIFKCIVLGTSYFIYFFCVAFDAKESDVKPLNGFMDNLLKSISPSTFTLMSCIFPDKDKSTPLIEVK